MNLQELHDSFKSQEDYENEGYQLYIKLQNRHMLNYSQASLVASDLDSQGSIDSWARDY